MKFKATVIFFVVYTIYNKYDLLYMVKYAFLQNYMHILMPHLLYRVRSSVQWFCVYLFHAHIIHRIRSSVEMLTLHLNVSKYVIVRNDGLPYFP